jgi:arginyl-tRNA synthetase
MDIFKKKITALLYDILKSSQHSDNFTKEFIYELITIPPNLDMGDYSFPCFKLAKFLRKKPDAIAKDLADHINKLITEVKEIVAVNSIGPYINFKISYQYMASITLPKVLSGEYFNYHSKKKKKVMIEYSQPNTHKGFHVGHIRNVALGDCLCNIFKYNGYDVIAANYIGDAGAHVAKCLWYYMNRNSESPPAAMKGEWLGALYSKATNLLNNSAPDEKKLYEKEISNILKGLENGDLKLKNIWEKTKNWSLEDFNKIYDWLNTKFDRVFYESEVDNEGKHLILEYCNKGVFEKSQGAIGIDLNDVDLGYFLLLKSDGNTLYSTKDIALAIKKFKEYEIDQSIYIVGAEQILHLKQVFETLKRMGYDKASDCFHLPYSLVKIPSGKMSSRVGNVILFTQLRDNMSKFINENYLSKFKTIWNKDEIEETTRRISIAAIKYGMLKTDTNQDIIFSIDDWLVSEGNTGVYLVYAYVRIMSIGEKIKGELSSDVDYKLLSDPNEKILIRYIYDFNEIVTLACEQYKPSVLTNYLFNLAKAFNRAYKECSVKNAESMELQAARWFLFYCVGQVLKKGLKLSGIIPPNRM